MTPSHPSQDFTANILLNLLDWNWLKTNMHINITGSPNQVKWYEAQVGHLTRFWIFTKQAKLFCNKFNLLPHKDKVGFGGGAFEPKIIFCSKWSKRVQTGPNGSQMVKNIYVDHFGSLWTTLECVWPILFVLLVRFFNTLYVGMICIISVLFFTITIGAKCFPPSPHPPQPVNGHL